MNDPDVVKSEIDALPPGIKGYVLLYGAWIVGGAAKPGVVSPRDWDVMVPWERWHEAKVLVPGKAVKNSQGGFKYMTDGIVVDVWPDTLDRLACLEQFKQAWHPKSGRRIYAENSTGSDRWDFSNLPARDALQIKERMVNFKVAGPWVLFNDTRYGKESHCSCPGRWVRLTQVSNGAPEPVVEVFRDCEPCEPVFPHASQDEDEFERMHQEWSIRFENWKSKPWTWRTSRMDTSTWPTTASSLNEAMQEADKFLSLLAWKLVESSGGAAI